MPGLLEYYAMLAHVLFLHMFAIPNSAVSVCVCPNCRVTCVRRCSLDPESVKCPAIYLFRGACFISVMPLVPSATSNRDTCIPSMCLLFYPQLLLLYLLSFAILSSTITVSLLFCCSILNYYYCCSAGGVLSRSNLDPEPCSALNSI